MLLLLQLTISATVLLRPAPPAAELLLWAWKSSSGN